MIKLLSAKAPAALMAVLATLLLAATSASAQMDFSPAAQAAPAPAAPTMAPVPIQPGPSQPDVGSSMVIGGAYGMQANKVYTGQLITLDFQNADIHNILRLIGEVSGKNVVVSDQVSGRVTLKLKDVPWDQALDTVLDSKNLGVIENGNILRIDTKDAIARLTPDISDPATRVALVRKIFTPKYASVTTLASELDKGKSMRGSVRVIGNDIYVEDDIYTMEAITKIFMRNDRVTNQILIEARIVEAGNNFTQRLGVSWGGAYDNKASMAPTSGLTDTLTDRFGGVDPVLARHQAVGAADIAGAATIGVGFLNRAGTFALSAELNASETMGHTKTVSAPRILASNDQEVYIKQGQQIPYNSEGTTTSPSSTEFKDAVMELRVTPHIEENGQIVTLDITLTKDSLGNPVEGADDLPIDTKEAKTKLMVRDGETVVIGGIITDTQYNTANHVPGLHRMPLLGWLFQNKTVNSDKTELLIFITAHIIPMNI
jgi:type IV pilus assembly protein PilQ